MNGMDEVAGAFEKAAGHPLRPDHPRRTDHPRYTSCIGMCDQAPAALINGVVVTGLSRPTCPPSWRP